MNVATVALEGAVTVVTTARALRRPGRLFREARSALIRPYPAGEEWAFAAALGLAREALARLGEPAGLGEPDVEQWAEVVLAQLAGPRAFDAIGEGPDVSRARAMTYGDKCDFADALDGLATWFDVELAHAR